MSDIPQSNPTSEYPPASGGQPPFVPQPGGLTGGSGDDGKRKGFFGALFDFSFTYFVTPIIVKIVYVIVTVALLLAWLIAVISGFVNSAGIGLLFLVGGAVAVIVYLALIRMTLELYLSIVRMSEDIHHRR